MYERILVTLDGSELSEAAIPAALRLALGTNARIEVLTVAEPPKARVRRVDRARIVPAPGAYGTATQPEFEEIEKEDESRQRVTTELKRYIDEKAAPLLSSGLDVTATVQFGDDAAETIASYAGEHGADAIVMATHGRSGIGKAIFGSVAQEVVRSGVAPVVLVKPRT